MVHFLLSLGNLFVSIFIGAALFFFCWVTLPEFILSLFKIMSPVREWVLSRGYPAQYEVALRFMVDEKQLVLLSFIVAARIIAAPILGFVYRLFGGRKEHAPVM